MGDVAKIENIKHFHEMLINYMLLKPTATNAELAVRFNRSPTHMSIIRNSDAFRARLTERQEQLFGEAVVETIRDKLTALASESLEKMIERVAVSDNDDFILAAANMATKNLGFGAPKSAAPPVQANFYIASPADIAQGRAVIEQSGKVE